MMNNVAIIPIEEYAYIQKIKMYDGLPKIIEKKIFHLNVKYRPTVIMQNTYSKYIIRL